MKEDTSQVCLMKTGTGIDGEYARRGKVREAEMNCSISSQCVYYCQHRPNRRLDELRFILFVASSSSFDSIPGTEFLNQSVVRE